MTKTDVEENPPREKNSSFSPIFLGMSLNSSHKEKRAFIFNK
jgi:hypothetical protein